MTFRAGTVASRLRLPLALIALAFLSVTWWQMRAPEPAPATPPAPVQSTRAAPDAAALSPSAPAEEARYDLGKDERRGGHTLARHVGRTDNDLTERLRREPGISAASTYTDRTVAERTVARTLAREQPQIASWLARRGSRPNLALDYRGPRSEVIGRSLRRRQQNAVSCIDAVVVLRWDGRDGYYVLTSYPEAR